MLREIYIKNFILIDELRLEFTAGLNVLSGETGAGKSIIIDALGLVLGERGSADLIREKDQKAVVEAVFLINDNAKARQFLEDNFLYDEEEEVIIIRREIAPNGKSIQRINQQNISLALIRQLTPLLVDMHLQHDNLRLLKSEQQQQILDALLVGKTALPKEVRKLYQQLQSVKKALEHWQENEKQKHERTELLNHQIREIMQAQLDPQEEEELLRLKERITSSEKLLAAAETIEQHLYHNERQPSAYDLLAAAIAAANTVDNDSFFTKLIERLEELYYALQEIRGELSVFKDQIDFEPGRLDEVESRLHLIQRLKRLYGSSIPEILNYMAAGEAELLELENSQVQINQLLEEMDSCSRKLQAGADLLSKARQEAAVELERKVKQELLELNLPLLRFEVSVQPGEEMRSTGRDQIHFLFSANPGEKMQPIISVASGGEISRFVLALKVALAQTFQVPTVIFDEIDVGVGGTSLAVMAEKIDRLSDYHQVILVTHSPQIACYAETHLLITKTAADDAVKIEAESLGWSHRSFELARMLDGENYTPLTVRHAEEMLQNNKKRPVI